MLIPWNLCPFTWAFLRSVTTAIGLSPAFSARVCGTTSKASAYALTQYAWAPTSSLEYSWSFWDTSISTALPPGTRALFFTRLLTTQSASWRDLSASSRTCMVSGYEYTSWFEPLSKIEIVFPWLGTPVIFTILLSPPTETSSISAAFPSLSAVKWSMWATGLALMVWRWWNINLPLQWIPLHLFQYPLSP